MGLQIKRAFIKLWEHSVGEEAAEADESPELEVNVIFTDSKSTLTALKRAGSLAVNLQARINLRVPQEVPLAFPLTRPPVAIPFLERRLLDLADQGAQGTLDTVVHLYLCRDKQQVLLRVLKPKSLVVIGGKKRWWPTKESKLAKMLQSKGHQVIFAGFK